MDLLQIVNTGFLRQTRDRLRIVKTELANQLIRFGQFYHLREGSSTQHGCHFFVNTQTKHRGRFVLTN